MSKDLLNRYIWIVDTVKRYGRITREELNACWRRSPYSDGEDIPRRTFYNYRQAIGEIFKISLECDPSTFEYYIKEDDDHNESVTNWLLNSTAMNSALNGSRDVAHRIFLEDVPSARDHLSLAIDAIRESHPLKFDYAPYSRSALTRGVIVEPYFLKLFKQRWYVTGRAVRDDTIKTYALDRMQSPVMMRERFEVPADFDAETYFRDSFGIVFTHGEVKDITLKVDARQSKYFRALPLHHSQQEMVHDEFSIFTYRMKITPDFVQELLSHGARVTVLQPPELKAMVVDELRRSLAQYDSIGVRK